MASSPAPIALFAFNRPQHTGECLTALAAAKLAGQTDVFVFIDGAKTSSGAELTRQVRDVVNAARGHFASLSMIERDRNWGLAANIIDGVTRLTAERGRVIVVEDDLVVHPEFLAYMNEALERLDGDKRVGSIHGYCYPGMQPDEPFFYMKGGDCWGWATWRDRWALFEPDGRKLLRTLIARRQLFEFTMGFSAAYCRMLCRQILGKNNSWAVRWHTSLFLNDRLTLYPARSLVRNIGFDGSGTHCDSTDVFNAEQSFDNVPPIKLNALPPPRESQSGNRYFQFFFCGKRRGLSQVFYRFASFMLDACWIVRAKAGR